MARKRCCVKPPIIFVAWRFCRLTLRQRASMKRGMARQIIMELLIMVAVGILMGLLGPFGSFALSGPERILYWVIWIVAGYALLRPTGVVAHWLCDRTGLPRLAGTGLAILIAAFPLAALVSMMVQKMGFFTVLRWPGFWSIYGYIWIIALVVSALTNAVFRYGPLEQAQDILVDGPVVAEPERESDGPATESQPNALSLPLGFGTITALKGEDHYVRVYGEHKSHLALMRLRDAMAMMAAGSGVQVHRSWWVAKDAVVTATREGRGAILTLRDGTNIPVSRDNMTILRDAGWL